MEEYQGSIELIGGLTQKNNGDFPLVNAKDVYQPTATAIPDDGIAQAGVMYFLGEITSLSVGFPETAKLGQMVYISFSSGMTLPTVSFTTANHVGLGDVIMLENRHYELIGMYNGTTWVFATREVAR